MKITFKTLLFCLFWGFITISFADDLPKKPIENNKAFINVDIFLTSTCPHCQRADNFLHLMNAKYPWLIIKRHVIDQDKSALQDFNQRLQQHHVNDFLVPSIFFCETRWRGFTDETHSGVPLFDALNYCHQRLIQTGKLSQANHQFLEQMAAASFYESTLKTIPSLVAFIPSMAIIDALNPSSFFIIMALAAMLITHKKRSWQVMIMLFFLLGVSFAHHIQQHHTTFFYDNLANIRIAVALVGLCLGMYVFNFYSNQIKHQPLSLHFILALTFLIALTIELYQQTYTPNIALIFQHWLSHVTPTRQVIYDLAYQLIYLATIGIIVMGILLCRKYQRLQRYYSFIKEFSLQYLLIISVILIGYPYLLSLSFLIFVVFVLASTSALLISKSTLARLDKIDER